MTHQYMSQLMDDGIRAPIELIGRDAYDDDILLREGLPAGPGGFVEDGILHVVGVGEDIQVDR